MSIPVTIGFDPATHAFAMPASPTQAPPGTDRIIFRRDGKHPGWAFFGIAIWPPSGVEPSQPGDICPPFREEQVEAHSIKVVDSNPGGADVTFNYKIWVTDSSDNRQYSSDPQILNKGG
jgi:hypothetical protein